jgi:hypothetical protein
VSQVFISYKREDETRVGRIAAALEKAGLDVWWDRGLPGGESWHANIEAKLAAAGCVVVVWSRGSIGAEGRYVRDEARKGLARGVLVPVLVDPIKDIPLGFGEVQAIDLVGWRGSLRSPHFQDLAAAIRAKLDGVAAPKPKGPVTRVLRRLLVGSLSGAVLAGIAAVAVNVIGAEKMASQVCTAPLLQPGLSDVCGACGVGARPTRAERLAWQARPAGSCPALRDHINRFPDGAYRSQAADLLAARRVSYEVSWTPSTRRLPLYVPAEGPSAGDVGTAKARAIARGVGQAKRLCRGFGAGPRFKFAGATPLADTWSCSGGVCSFDGWAECDLQESRQAERESCGTS